MITRTTKNILTPGITIGLAALVGVLQLPAANADMVMNPWKLVHSDYNTVKLEPSFGFFTSTANYDDQNTLVSPQGLGRYSRLDMNILGSYGFSRLFTAFGRFSWTRIDLQHDTQTGNVFGPTDQTAGLTARIWDSKKISVDLQGQIDFPMYSNSESANQGMLFLGNGSVDGTIGSFVTLALWQGPTTLWGVTGGAGYTYRSAGFSAAIPWSLGLHLRPYENVDRGFFVGAGLSGFQSLKTDATPYTHGGTGAGGSFMINAVNPSLFSIDGEFGYRLAKKVAFSITGSRTLFGQSAPSGINVTLNFQARWGKETVKNPAAASGPEYGRSNQGFVPYAFEAKVNRVNDRLNVLRIDKGSQDGVAIGQVFDIFVIKPDGSTGDAIARAKCTSVKTSEAALTITEYFKEVWIEEGFIVKRPLQ